MSGSSKYKKTEEHVAPNMPSIHIHHNHKLTKTSPLSTCCKRHNAASQKSFHPDQYIICNALACFVCHACTSLMKKATIEKKAKIEKPSLRMKTIACRHLYPVNVEVGREELSQQRLTPSECESGERAT